MARASRILVGIPVYNEQRHVMHVLEEIRQYAGDVLVIDDGSTDQTPCLLAKQPVEVIRHAENRGYGRSMQDMLRWAQFDGFDWLITMDCDEQHEPAAIPEFVRRIERDDADVISGTRYLHRNNDDDCPPMDRRAINEAITDELKERLGLVITDAFCGFKAYRVSSCAALDLDVDGYEFPMQFWVQAVANRLRIVELPVRLIYNDPSRSFGGPLDEPTRRLQHYRQTLYAELLRCRGRLPETAVRGLQVVAEVSEVTALPNGLLRTNEAKCV